MTAKPIQIAELDFADIKENLKTYLRSQSEFEDYDFDGSGLAILIDILAANTLYNAYYLHMATNESFLDSALIRKNLVSRAKAIGYTPTSRRSARATISIQFFPPSSPASILVPEGTKFNTVVDNVNYTFSTLDAHTCIPDSNLYILPDVEIVEGERLTHRFTIDNDTYTPSSKLRLPNAGVDTSWMKVKVQKSSTDTGFVIYKLSNDINELNGESKVYFLQEADDLQYELYFGDGVLGKQLDSGNIVIVEYAVSSGDTVNKAATFEAIGSVGGITNVKLTTISAAAGGIAHESDETIRFTAPLAYQAQNRAVTKTDYEILIKKDYPAIDAVRVWGGEENDPKQYGRVFMSLKPIEGLTLSTTLKSSIANTIIKPRNLVSVEVVLVDPEYLYLVIEATVKYRSTLTNDSEGTIKQEVLDAIIGFGDNELNQFDASLRYSKLVRAIDDSHVAIQSSLTTIKLKINLAVSFTSEQKYIINFANALDSNMTKPTLSSTGFIYNGFTCFLQDDGLGKVQIYRNIGATKAVVVTSAGTINYSTGKIELDRLLITGTASGDDFVEVSARPLTNDITTVRNQILIIDEAAIGITMTDEATL